jgi:hypothetical protein
MATTCSDLMANDLVADPPGLCERPAEGNYLNMGLGALGNGDVIFKRKFRWTFEIAWCCSVGQGRTVPASFVKMGNRPQIDFEEIEINYLNGKMFIPGKGTWQPLSITYYDVAGLVSGSATSELLSWIASIYDFTNPECLKMNSSLETYSGKAKLMLYDGCGNPLESWILNHVWPQSVNWGDLDMGSSDECTIELTLRYDSVEYASFCPAGTIFRCECPPCPTAPQAVAPPQGGGGGSGSQNPFALR